MEEVEPVGVVVYDDSARVIEPEELKGLCFAFFYGSNIAAALKLACQLLDGPGRIKLVTYCSPSSCTLDDGTVYFAGDEATIR